MKTFNFNGETKTVALSAKSTELGIEKFHITGRRWFQKSFGNTYHSSTISALIGGSWVDLGKVNFEYGYGEQYLTTGGAWLIENGFIDSDEKGGYFVHKFAGTELREVLNIEHSVQDVNRKRDL